MAITKRAEQERAARELRAAKREGGQKRWADEKPADALAVRRKAAAAVNGPVGLARRLAKAWPDASDDERREVVAVLAGAHVAEWVEAGADVQLTPWQREVIRLMLERR